MKPLYCLAALAFVAQPVYAGSWYEKKAKGALLYDTYKKAGVPEQAVQRTFEFLDINEEKEFKVRAADRLVSKEITNKNYAIVIDFSKPSSERRLYLLNLKTGDVEKYYVAHGVNTGDDEAEKFSNTPDSKKSSLGLYLTGSPYVGKHGESLYLYGLEKSNDRAFERSIVMHGASYVSTDFLDKYGRMGRSWGCPAVSQAIIKKLIPIIKDGAVVYAYHKDLMPMTQTSPTVQNVSNNKTKTSNNSEDIVPEEIDP
ncbi:murein L,D-transpeptidase catalytic domain family protein [Bdellovibrio svalbardensis]|uniref:Murein L,D-transpeptidase catalytic domain family protein n=1 Tax=Bdellovibrio svalbardensis TaxID=2972972 RepID=A0ABT6DMZ1_9BACT|nr:murein L,D-transpeptidase catalytic domain family protein [Bdellovibrio svalbardensis]MDG0818249.1 murein L,D-transpeptidase catalytic domain family protein [Bdellovibrio svalbardensis]